MKQLLFAGLLGCLLFTYPKLTRANVLASDSLALVDLYNSTGGPQWTKHTNWLSADPVETWSGIQVEDGRVVTIGLWENNLTGTLPASIGDLTGVQRLYLYNNHLNGSIPSSIGNLVNVVYIALSNNQFSGSIPSSLSNCIYLYRLNLDNNQLTGAIPASLGSLPAIEYLELNNNLLTGQTPPELGQLTKLQTLRLSYNQLSGNIPPQLCNLNNANIIEFYDNQLTGQIPSAIGNLTALFALNLGHNQLSGTIPPSINQLTRLDVLDLSQNALTGNIPDMGNMLALHTIYLYKNSLSGNLPGSFSNLVGLQSLLLYNNQLSGPIPGSYGSLTHLGSLDLSNNRLSGDLPPGLNLSTSIVFLLIQNNQFSFAGMEELVNHYQTKLQFVYAPQDSLRLILDNQTLSVAAGATLAHNTYHWYKDGSLFATKTGDSTVALAGPGDYYVTITNTIAVNLTLYTKHHVFGSSRQLATLSGTTIQNLQGIAPVEINDSSFNKILRIEPINLHGDVQISVTIDPAFPRKYTVTPSVNPGTSSANLTLYYTQADFDAYNAYVNNNHLPFNLLPSSPADNGSIRITKMDADTVTAILTPTASWDAANNWWTLQISVTGFSDFVVSSPSMALPLSLLQFDGTFNNNGVQLHWLTTNETNTEAFIVEVSPDGRQFTPIGRVNALSSPGNHFYTFGDDKYLAPKNYYRLQMIDKDGRYTYSKTIVINGPTGVNSLFPNPVKSFSTLRFSSAVAGSYQILIYDPAGKTVQQYAGNCVPGLNEVRIEAKGWATGQYSILLRLPNQSLVSWKLVKE